MYIDQNWFLHGQATALDLVNPRQRAMRETAPQQPRVTAYTMDGTNITQIALYY